MLLDEDPATLIHECTSNFHTASDRDALNRITDTLSTLSSSRSTRLNTATSSLKKLQRRLQNLQQQHEIMLHAHNPSEHAEGILRLDGEKFRIAKEASDAEIEGERLEGDVRRAEIVLKDLEEGRMGEGEKGDAGADRDVLKLKLYRSLGIDAEPDADGQYRRAVVRNADRGDVHVVDIDPQYSRSYYANKFWAVM